MNICLENVVFCDQKGLHYKFSNYAVRYRNIMYLKVPDEVRLK